MFVRILFCFLLLGIGPSKAVAGRDQAGQFDYYILSLSWSPTYCNGKAAKRDGRQCAPGQRYAFVVHGLWPQRNASWVQSCGSDELWVPDGQVERMLDIMPSKALIIHEWKKHGTCSGLNQQAYFSLTRELFGKVRIPARYLSPTNAVVIAPSELVADFVKTNRGLEKSMTSVHCGNRRDKANLRELRICFSRNGDLRACANHERRSCRAKTLVLPPVR